MATYYYNHRNPKFPVYVTDETLKLTPHTFTKNRPVWEEKSIDYFYDNIPSDKPITVVDIGAQTGLYTLYAKHLPQSTFYSFEPFLQSYNVLNDNIALNKITNVKTYNIGISNYKGETILNTSKSHNGLHTIGSKPTRFRDIAPITINVDTLDNLFYEKDISVDFMKIDTEGWEYYILEGGKKTIEKYKPMIQLEWNKENMAQCNVNIYRFQKYIENVLGYTKKNMIAEELFIVYSGSSDAPRE